MSGIAANQVPSDQAALQERGGILDRMSRIAAFVGDRQCMLPKLSAKVSEVADRN